MLEVRDLQVMLGDYQALWSGRVEVGEGEIVALLGPNGAGKSTLMNSVSGLLRPRAGAVVFRGRSIAGLPAHRIVREGISHVLERRRLFPYLTVRQNVWLGGYHERAKRRAAFGRRAHAANRDPLAARDERLRKVTELFPLLEERGDQLAHTLSGGEQQMVAIARGLMAGPRLLMIDEPFLGLAPRIVDQIAATIRRINEEGVSVLFVEQNVELALSLARRAFVLESGRTVVDGTSDQLRRSPELRRIFLGG